MINNNQPIEESQITNRDKLPYFVPFTPPGPVTTIAPGAVSIPLDWKASPRDFVCTHISWTSTLQGIPRHIEPFRVSIEDVSAMKSLTNGRVDLSAITGVGIDTTEYNGMFLLSEPWRFKNGTVIRVVLENRGCHAATPTFLMHGYFDTKGEE